LSPIAPEKYVNDEEPRENSYFFFLPRQSIYTDQMLALEEKKPLYAYEKGGTPLVKVYSGEAVAGTLDIEGEPEAKDLGLLNALISFGGAGAVLALLRWKQYQGKEW
jgi:hypothetical protein